jgi:hypothetical protein
LKVGTFRGIRSWKWSSHDVISVPIRGDRRGLASYPSFARKEHMEKMIICKTRSRPHQTLDC